MSTPVKHWVFDLETLSNCFIGVFEHYKTDERKIFIIHELHNDTEDLVKFLGDVSQNGQWLISFNGIGFDSQVLGYLLEKKWLHNADGDIVARALGSYANKVINKQDRNSFTDYPEWKLPFKQVDLMKLHHWDAKGCGLKWAQFSMDWHNVQDMPIHHSTKIETWDQIHTILDYCINDVTSTKHILGLSKEQVNLRANLTKEYGINLYSASEPRISKELFAYFLSEKLNIDKRMLKEMRTPRERILAKDIILPYIKFNTPEFQKMHEWFRNLDIDYTLNLTEEQRKKRYKYTMTYRGVNTDYGLGGIHGARSGIFTAREGYIIMTSDVTSFYPNLAIRNHWSPFHIPQVEFCEQYEWFFDERKKIPKKDPRNYVYKIILNSTYGLSKDENSFLYDPEFTMKITINGQLSLSMLYEMLAERIPGAIPLMQNTDGIEMMISERYKDEYLKICAEWEKITKLQLEHDQYEKMFIWDVNNYIAVTVPKKVKDDKDGTPAKVVWEKMQADNLGYVFFEQNGEYFYQATKCKGRFEWEDQHKKKVGVLHKNKSFLIIPKAIFNYCIYGTKPEEYLQNNRNIFDYCGAVKATEGWYFTAEYAETADGSQKASSKKLQKMNRYYVSTKGCKILKKNVDGRVQRVISGNWHQTIFNLYQELPWEAYNVDDNYYLRTIYKEITAIKPVEVATIQTKREYKQMEMFG